jgi:hypothetical protein
MADATADLLFLPWLRRGAAAAFAQPDTLGGQQPGVASANVELVINSGAASVRVPIRVMGPGHVTGLDSRQIVRTDPAPGSRGFEPNYLPLIEFDDATVPWLFTPASANAQARLRPWLVLVVLRLQPGVTVRVPRGEPLPVLEIRPPAMPTLELPDLADSWAWAHAQVTAPPQAPIELLQSIIATRPELSVSRLLCPRLLQPDTEYVACVVPAFELGRKAGLGVPITKADETALEPAWRSGAAAPTSLDLPVFHHWQFATGAGGDFESLALLLRPRPVPASVGRRPIDVSSSGLALDPPIFPGTTLALDGALRPVRATDAPWPAEARKTDLRNALAAVLNLPAAVTGGEPLLAPPLYGAAQARRDRVDPNVTTRWFEQLNLDPMLRAVAGFGTRAIQQHQEALMASAWTQAGDLARVNQYLRQCQLGCAVAASLHVRHFAPMAPDTGLQVFAPAHARLASAAAAAGTGRANELAARLRATGLSRSAFGSTLRRLARPRGALNRRVERTVAATTAVRVAVVPTVTRTEFVLGALQPTAVLARSVVNPPRLVTFDAVAASLAPPRTDVLYSEGTATAVSAAPRRPDFAFVPLPVATVLPPRVTPTVPPVVVVRRSLRRPGDPPELPEPEEPTEPVPRPPRIDSADARVFRVVARAHLARFRPERLIPQLPVTNFTGTIRAAFDEVLLQSEPGRTFAARARAVVLVPGMAPRPESEVLEPLPWAPRFEQPMAEALAELSPELLLPGIEAVLPNTVVPLATNTPFVQAFMVGLNSEMTRELLWRGFPAALDATFFDRFWDARSTPDAPPDVEPAIAAWGDRPLGTGTSANPPGAKPERFVVLVRSELLRRYPNALIYAVTPGPPRTERQPVFSGALPPDVRFFGFDFGVEAIRGGAIVIQEQPTEPRFGIDVGTPTNAGTHLAASEPNAARMAEQTRQLPVRITLPAALLLE